MFDVSVNSLLLSCMKNCLLVFSVLCMSVLHAQLAPTFDDIQIPMSDGKFLSADVYVPSGCSGNCEAILIQTPYNKDVFETSGLPLGIGKNLNSQPFVWVIVDWRGFYASASAAVASPDRGKDGYDVCDWIVAQSWHGSKIGTWGASALGGIQYQLINKKHPNHACAVPLVADGQTAYDGYFTGGVLEQARLEQLDALGYGLSTTIYANPYYNTTWSVAESQSDYSDDISIPTLQIGGWYDHNIDRMMRFYKRSRTVAAANVRDKQWLLVGPWVHGGTGLAFVGSPTQGQLSYPNAAFKNNTMAMDFFNFYLRGQANNWESTPKITYYETGNDKWSTSNSDDIASMKQTKLYLSSNKILKMGVGTGTSSFISDPSKPVPTIGGATLSPNLDQGPYDQSSLDSRSDVVTFVTDALVNDLSISGKMNLKLNLTSTQPDCDIAVRVVDTYPDGRDMLITDGIKRMRFRNGYTKADEVFMTAGVSYPVTVELPFTNYTWKSGHKVKIYISATHSTRFAVNLQDGGVMYKSGATPKIATITIQHDANNPSSITLPGESTLGLTDDVSNATVEVYPNPSKTGRFYLRNEHLKIVNISTVDGKQVAYKTDSEAVELLHAEAGVYIIQFENGSVSKVRVDGE